MVNNNPIVSIIIPVYNGENFLKEAIESALAQSYPFIEILVINDGSTDNTEKIAQNYKDRIRYFYKNNGGVASALNYGIQNMIGSYFSWLSHDDLYKPDKIKNQIDFIKSNNLDENSILYGGYTYITKKGKKIQQIDLDHLFPHEQLDKSLFCVFFQEANGCTMLIPKINFTLYGMFNENLKTTQDYDLWYRMIKNCDIYYCHTNDVCMRLHQSQGSRNLNHMQESNSLWSYMIDDIDMENMIKIKGNPIYFIDQLKKYLYSSGFVSTEVETVLREKKEKIYKEISDLKELNDLNAKRLVMCIEKSRLYLIDFEYKMKFNFRFRVYNIILMIKNRGIKYTLVKILEILKQKVR